VGGQPLSLAQAGREVEMPATLEGTAEAACDKERVAGAASRTGDARARGHGAGHENAAHEGTFRVTGFTSDHGDAVDLRGLGQTSVQGSEVRDKSARADGKGNQRMTGRAPHRSDVADRATEGLPSDTAHILAKGEVDALHNGIHLQQFAEFQRGSGDHHGAVISGTEFH